MEFKTSLSKIYSNSIYWDVYNDDEKLIGTFGVLWLDQKLYTDIELKKKYRGKGYFKLVYDYFINHLWDDMWHTQTLYAFVGKNNIASQKAHQKYGCKLVKTNRHTYIYLVKKAVKNG